nr:hypothetical protein [uncultured Rhodopila sp.]
MKDGTILPEVLAERERCFRICSNAARICEETRISEPEGQNRTYFGFGALVADLCGVWIKQGDPA